MGFEEIEVPARARNDQAYLRREKPFKKSKKELFLAHVKQFTKTKQKRKKKKRARGNGRKSGASTARQRTRSYL